MTHATRIRAAVFASLLTLWLPAGAGAQAGQPGAAPPVALAIDLRGRLESDVSSRREDGTLRDDRHRARIRARVELRGRPSRAWLLVARVRTGSPRSQQSPHLTIADLSGGSADRFAVVADRFSAQYTAGRFDTWVGRNEFPFWTQNEMFWDRDVTLPGGFVAYRAPLRRASLQTRAGVFGLPDGAVDIRGRMAAGQAVLETPLSRAWSLQAAVGLFDMAGARATRHLLSGNGTRDYRIATGSVQIARALRAGAVGQVRVGADVLRNVRAYSGDADPVAQQYRGARTGVVLTSAVSGRRRPGARGSWEVGHTFARIEKLAVNASFAQDDWVRWGSATQTDGSNLRGHEVSGRYWLSPGVDLHARAFVARSLTTPQDGTRVRLDLNWRFGV